MLHIVHIVYIYIQTIFCTVLGYLNLNLQISLKQVSGHKLDTSRTFPKHTDKACLHVCCSNYDFYGATSIL